MIPFNPLFKVLRTFKQKLRGLEINKLGGFYRLIAFIYLFLCRNMKTKIAYQFLSLLMAALVLFSSAGLSLNAHYCNTMNTMEKSLLPFPIACDHDDGSSCQIPPRATEASCCTIAEETGTMHAQHISKDENCCEDFFRYIKVITEFELPQLKIKDLFNRFLVIILNLFELVFADSSGEKPQANLFEQPPKLLLSGKNIAIAFHQLKIGHFLL